MAVLVWPFGSMIADRDGFARWVLCNGGVGSEMGLSRMVAASQREWWQDGSLLPLSFSVLLPYSLSLSPVTFYVSPLTFSSSSFFPSFFHLVLDYWVYSFFRFTWAPPFLG